jgi:hypothetical protein
MVYIATWFYPNDVTLYLFSILVGLAASMTWVAAVMIF